MITLVLGGSGSGKSQYAERLLDQYSSNKYYLATMKITDEEDLAKVNRHKELRSGKGFTTLEKPCDISGCIDVLAKSDDNVVLLECITNLAANEMFKGSEITDCDKASGKIIRELEKISEYCKELVIVSANVFEDGQSYDLVTNDYIKLVAMVNEGIAMMAGRVIEVCCGCPIYIKGIKTESEAKLDDSSICSNEQSCLDKYMDKKGILVYIGGCGQDKLSYVIKHNPGCEKAVVNDFHLYIRELMREHKDVDKEVDSLIDGLISTHGYALIICDEIGNGIVPMDAFEREYREKVGRILERLVSKASSFERIICGLGQKLK